MLDLVDQRIVEILQQDGRASNSEIARRIGVTESTVRRRIDRLARNGTIFVAAFLNPLHFGYTGLAIIGVTVDPVQVEAVTEAITAFDEVRYLALSLGRYDLIVEAALRDPSALRGFLTDKLGPIPGIRSVEPHIVPTVLKFADRYWTPDGWGSAEVIPVVDAAVGTRG
jgi:Lrp/AsnC family transcriptional regulator for asnA, asnC and gidA